MVNLILYLASTTYFVREEAMFVLILKTHVHLAILCDTLFSFILFHCYSSDFYTLWLIMLIMYTFLFHFCDLQKFNSTAKELKKRRCFLEGRRWKREVTRECEIDINRET